MLLERPHPCGVLADGSFFLPKAKPEIRFSLLGLANGLLMGTFCTLDVDSKDLRLLAGPIHLGVTAILDAPQVLSGGFALLGRGRLSRGQVLLRLAAIALGSLQLQFQGFLTLARLGGLMFELRHEALHVFQPIDGLTARRVRVVPRLVGLDDLSFPPGSVRLELAAFGFNGHALLVELAVCHGASFLHRHAPQIRKRGRRGRGQRGQSGFAGEPLGQRVPPRFEQLPDAGRTAAPELQPHALDGGAFATLEHAIGGGENVSFWDPDGHLPFSYAKV